VACMGSLSDLGLQSYASRDALHRSMRVPDLRKGDHFPLRSFPPLARLAICPFPWLPTQRICRCGHNATCRIPSPLVLVSSAKFIGSREGEVVQAIERARGVNRTAANPVDVLVMTDVVLPFPIEPVEAADLEPSPIEMMLAAGDVGLENAAHAAICYPDLWPNADAARQAMHRAKRSVTNPYEELLIGECHTPPITVNKLHNVVLTNKADLGSHRSHPAIPK
jgi:hypothetical protein